MPDDSRFFTMKQLWQSLAIVAVIVGGFAFVGMHAWGTSIDKGGDQAKAATTTIATTSQPAAAAAAVPAPPKEPFTSMGLSAQAAIVVDLSNGQTIYSQNADKELPLASLTKLLTIYEAQKALSSASPVTVSSSSLAQYGEYGLAEGETFAYGDIARFAMVASSNDAAEAIAEAAAATRNQSVPEFMASAVQDAGLSHTTASSATGLDLDDLSQATAYGSARDIAKLAGAFLGSAPDIAAATTRRSVSITSLAGVPHSLSNTNPDVSSMPGILLSKTGYTDLAGGNLAIVFDAGIGHKVAVVVLGSTPAGRFSDAETLMHSTLASFAKPSIAE